MRDKIVTDLMCGGMSPAVYVEHPAVPRSMRKATQDELTTDGRLALIWLPLSR